MVLYNFRVSVPDRNTSVHDRRGLSGDLGYGLGGSVGTKYRLLELAILSRRLANIWKLTYAFLYLRVGFDAQEKDIPVVHGQGHVNQYLV